MHGWPLLCTTASAVKVAKTQTPEARQGSNLFVPPSLSQRAELDPFWVLDVKRLRNAFFSILSLSSAGACLLAPFWSLPFCFFLLSFGLLSQDILHPWISWQTSVSLHHPGMSPRSCQPWSFVSSHTRGQSKPCHPSLLQTWARLCGVLSLLWVTSRRRVHP